MKLFDCHCHVHLGPRGISPLLQAIPQPLSTTSTLPSQEDTDNTPSFMGAAIMSTHPRDYAAVDSVVSTLREFRYQAVPCYGIHPWFLHEVHINDNNEGEEEEWLVELRQRLINNPDAIVGEIGLDGARWREVEVEEDDDNEEDTTNIWNRQRMLSCPMNLQRRAFEQQLFLAAKLQRPVSIHIVRAWGELFDSLAAVRNMMKLDEEEEKEDVALQTDENKQSKTRKKKSKQRLLLPPKMYFHAFSGKAGVISSVLAACKKGNVPRSDIYFGFPPAIPNFNSPKTPSVMRQIGINQLVLETDLEDSTNCWGDLNQCAKGIALALEMDVVDVARITYENAEKLYFGK